MIKINFHLKEDPDMKEDGEITISIIRKGSGERSQSVNAKKIDDLSATEQQTIKSLESIVDKYRIETGSTELKYSL